MLENLSKTIESISKIEVSAERKAVLQPLVDYIQNKVNTHEEIRLNFICTHNSRRSHLSQIWAQTMAFHFNIKNVFCYSGGTEATSMFPKVGETLQNQGFEILQLSESENPVYAIKFSENKNYGDLGIFRTDIKNFYDSIDRKILMKKLEKAAFDYDVKEVAIAGGVSANSGLREAMQNNVEKLGWNVYIPKFEYTTDNAAMIGIVGYQKFLENKFNDAGVVSKARIEF